MRRLIAVAAAFAGAFVYACASSGAPPGGPEDHEAPQILKVTPDSGETNAKVRAVEFQFDEVVNDRAQAQGSGLNQMFLISPRNGAPRVSWHRSRITVRPERGFRDNTAYKITLLPGLGDLRGNVRKDPMTIVFSTGATFPQFSIPGTVFDWAAQRPAPNAYVEAVLGADTSVVYLGAADTAGKFDIGPLPGGTYIVRAIVDQNNNRALDRNEKWDSLLVTLVDSRSLIELLAIERDTMPPLIDNINVLDSVSVRVQFDKALDPALPLQPALVRIQRRDSSQLEVARIEWATPFERARQVRDSARIADSIRAARPPGAAPPPVVAPPVVTPGGVRPPPPAPKPRLLPPDRAIVVTLAPTNRVLPDSTYRFTARGMRNLLGRTAEAARRDPPTRTFTVPKPPPPPRPDTTRRPPPR